MKENPYDKDEFFNKYSQMLRFGTMEGYTFR